MLSVRSGNKIPQRPKRDHFRSPIDKAKAHEVIWQNVSRLFDATRRIEKPSFVYFIGEPDGPLKIGLSKDPIARLRGMQTGNPRRLRIEYVLLGDLNLEKLMQEMWRPHAILSANQIGKPDALPGTEWFQPEVRAALEPIVFSAVEMQIQWLHQCEDTFDWHDAERLVREAHGGHDFVAVKKHQTLLLSTDGGIMATRKSRI